MKQLSIEEKAKRYNEAIKRAKELLEIGVKDTRDKGVVLSFFPELKESEDEKMRKSIIYALRNGGFYDNDKTDEAIAWLEKQGEHKSIWHNEDEEPQRGSLILLIMQSGTPVVAKIVEPNHTFTHGERWAYIEDLYKLVE